MVASFLNTASTPFNASALVGVIVNPADHSQVYMNLSAAFIGDIVDVDTDRAFDYPFYAPRWSDVREIGVVVRLFYADVRPPHNQYSNVVFNQTLTLVLPAESVSASIQRVLPYLLATCLGLGGIYFMRGLFFPPGTVLKIDQAVETVMAMLERRKKRKVTLGGDKKRQARLVQDDPDDDGAEAVVAGAKPAKGTSGKGAAAGVAASGPASK